MKQLKGSKYSWHDTGNLLILEYFQLSNEINGVGSEGGRKETQISVGIAHKQVINSWVVCLLFYVHNRPVGWGNRGRIGGGGGIGVPVQLEREYYEYWSLQCHLGHFHQNKANNYHCTLIASCCTARGIIMLWMTSDSASDRGGAAGGVLSGCNEVCLRWRTSQPPPSPPPTPLQTDKRMRTQTTEWPSMNANWWQWQTIFTDKVYLCFVDFVIRRNVLLDCRLNWQSMRREMMPVFRWQIPSSVHTPDIWVRDN